MYKSLKPEEISNIFWGTIGKRGRYYDFKQLLLDEFDSIRDEMDQKISDPESILPLLICSCPNILLTINESNHPMSRLLVHFKNSHSKDNKYFSNFYDVMAHNKMTDVCFLIDSKTIKHIFHTASVVDSRGNVQINWGSKNSSSDSKNNQEKCSGNYSMEPKSISSNPIASLSPVSHLPVPRAVPVPEIPQHREKLPGQEGPEEREDQRQSWIREVLDISKNSGAMNLASALFPREKNFWSLFRVLPTGVPSNAGKTNRPDFHDPSVHISEQIPTVNISDKIVCSGKDTKATGEYDQCCHCLERKKILFTFPCRHTILCIQCSKEHYQKSLNEGTFICLLCGNPASMLIEMPYT
jgi:hypothetical protein